MGRVFSGSAAVAAGLLTPGQLRWRYRAIYPDVYVPRDAPRTLHDNTAGAYLWSGGRGVITGRAAAALHGARWVDEHAPVEVLHANCHPPAGVITRRERIGAEEITELQGILVATPPRVALDLGRHLPRMQAVAHLDALGRATGITRAEVLRLSARYPGTRGVRRFRSAIELMDAGAQSPKESWLRLVLIDAGFPWPRTQIPIRDDTGYPYAYLDMGWEHLKIALEYDGDHHRTDRLQYVKDIRRLADIERRGWLVIRVVAEDRPRDVVARVRQLWARREGEAGAVDQAG